MRDTIDMAREAGLLTWLKPPEDVIERLKAFEALVRADEREQIEDEWSMCVMQFMLNMEKEKIWLLFVPQISEQGGTHD